MTTTLNITNPLASHIAYKGINKHMGRRCAVRLWNILKSEGWIRGEGSSLIRPEECEGAFHFVRISDTKTSVFYADMEVAS